MKTPKIEPVAKVFLVCVALLLAAALLSGLSSCATIEKIATGGVTTAAVATNKTLDTIAAPIKELVEQWCALLEYRQEHLGGLVNGMLAEQNKAIDIDCDTTEL